MLMSWAARGVYANPCTEGQVQAPRNSPLGRPSGPMRKTISGVVTGRFFHIVHGCL